MFRAAPAVALLAAALTLGPAASGGARVEVLQSTGGLPAHVAGQFQEPVAFQQIPGGDSFVFDRRAHAVYRVDAAATDARKIVEIGFEEGRILQPGAFDLEPEGSFVVADAPNGRERIQIFRPDGVKIGGFDLPGRTAARITIGSLVLNGVGSLDYTGRSVLINQPETGALITEYTLSGRAVRTIGRPRPTGHENERDIHLALNTGLPLAHPAGGFLQREKDASRIDVENVIVIRLCVFDQRFYNMDAGVGDHNIQGPDRLFGFVEQPAHFDRF